MRNFLLGLVLGLLTATASGQTVGNGSATLHVEKVTITNGALTCGLATLCSVGTSAAFATSFPDTNYRCAFSPVGTTLAATSFTPVVSTKATGTVTVSADTIVALTAASVQVDGMCVE